MRQSRRRPWRRRLLLVLGACLLGGLTVRHFLLSPRLAHAIAERLETIYGARVVVGSADVGLRGSSVHDLAFFESDAGPDAEPWAVIGEARADIPLWDLARGRTLAEPIELIDADLRLHFDARGHLSTHLPPPNVQGGGMPSLRLQRASVHLVEQGRPELTVTDIDGMLIPHDDRLVLNATVNDPTWGHWTVRGTINRTDATGTVSLSSSGTHVTQAMLDSIPWVPAVTWQQVRLEGDTTADILVRFTSQPRDVSYRVSLEPHDTEVHVAAIDLEADHASGTVLMEDGVVRLYQVHGQAAGGTVDLDSELDFRGVPDRLHFVVAVQRLDVHRLPLRWKVPRLVNGRLTGKADLRIEVANGRTHTSGTGDGLIHDARIVGIPARPIHIEVRPTGAGFRFGGPQDIPPLPTPAAFGEQAAASYLPALLSAPAPAIQTMTVDLGMDDVEVAALLRGFGVQAPVAIGGRVSFRLRAAIPLDTPQQPQTYRAEGTADARLLTIAGVELSSVHARIWYAHGMLRLTQLRARVPASGEWAGAIYGGASARLEPLGDLNAQADIERLRVEAIHPLARAVGHVRGQLQGRVEWSVPLASLGQFAAWNISASVASNGLQLDRWSIKGLASQLEAKGGLISVRNTSFEVNGVPIRNLTASGQAGKDHVTITEVVGNAADGRISGSARWIMGQRAEADVKLHVADADARLIKLANVPGGSTQGGREHALGARRHLQSIVLRGRFSALLQASMAPAEASGRGRWIARLSLEAPRLEVDGVPVDKVRAALQGDGEQVAYRVEGDGLGGHVRLSGDAPDGTGRLQIEGASFGRLAATKDLGGGLAHLHARVDLDVPFRTGPDGWPTGEGRFTISRLRWNQTELGELDGILRVRDGHLNFSNLDGEIAGGSVRGGATIPFGGSVPSRLNITLDGADVAQLLAPWPDLASDAEGTVNLRLVATPGRNWHGSGRAEMPMGRIGGVDISQLELPLDFAFADGRARIDVRDTTVVVAQGRAVGHATVFLGMDSRLDGQARFTNVDLGMILRQVGATSQSVSGQLTGQIDFSANEFTSLSDLSASLNATLQQTRAAGLPIFEQVVSFVPGLSSSSSFQSGEVRARLSTGVLRIERLTLRSSSSQLLATGEMTTQGGLNLDVTANSGGSRMPAFGPLSGALVLTARNLLAVASVHLHVGGTVHNPLVQIEPLTTLSDDALRFFTAPFGPSGP